MYLSKKDLTILQKDRIITHYPYLIELYKKFQLALYVHCGDCDFEGDVVVYDEVTARKGVTFYENNYPRVWKCVEKIVTSNYRKRSRVAKRFTKLLSTAINPIYFGTITFTDFALDNISQKTRRVYVRRFLKRISNEYIANIDFGDLHNREHYHCIFSCDDIKKFKLWEHGFVNVKQIRHSEEDYSRITKYTVKLINHCVKGSAGFVIASRQRS